MGRGSTLLLVEMLHSGSIRKCSGIVTVRQPAVEMSLFVLNVFFEDIKVSRLLSVVPLVWWLRGELPDKGQT